MNWMCEWFGVCSRLIISTRALIGMANGKEGILFGCSFKFQIIVSWDKCLINLEKGFCVVVREEERMGQKVNKFTQQSTLNLHDFLSAFRVRFRSRGCVLVPGALVAVFTRLSKISSSPSVNSSREIIEGVRKLSGRRRRRENVPESGLSKPSPGLLASGVPRICLK